MPACLQLRNEAQGTLGDSPMPPATLAVIWLSLSSVTWSFKLLSGVNASEIVDSERAVEEAQGL